MATKSKPAVYTISEDEYRSLREDGGGICLACGEIASGVEPDARNYPCESCEENRVFGIEEALLMGRIKFAD